MGLLLIGGLFCLSVLLIPTELMANTKKTQASQATSHSKSSIKHAKKTSKKSQKRSAKPQAEYIPPYAHILVDASTGRVISQKNADAALYPASLTKIMTLLMTFEALDAKKINLRSSVLISSHAASMSPSKIGLKPGKSISVDNAIRAIATKSANDISVAIAERLGGSESRFAKLMTAKAHQIGMTQTHFVNASGLHNSRQVSSARDMAKLAIYVMRTHPHYYRYFSLKEFYFDGKTHTNHNRLMSTYSGMDGMKTGYIRQSGFNLVSSAKRGNTRLIGVIFGGKTANSRNEQMARLLNSGFGRGTYNADNSNIEPYTPPHNSVRGQKNQPILTLNPPSRPPKPFETGTGQSASLLKKPTLPPVVTYENKTSQTESVSPDGWAIQIGAFQDRVSTDQALYHAIKNLPAPLNRGNAVIVPLRTAEATWVFRARIAGYTRDQAIRACSYLNDCMTISPNTN